MSNLTDAINNLNTASNRAVATTEFYSKVADGDENVTVTNPNSGVQVPSFKKMVNDIYTDENVVVEANASKDAAAQSATEAAASAASIGTELDARTWKMWAQGETTLAGDLRKYGSGKDSVIVYSDVDAVMELNPSLVRDGGDFLEYKTGYDIDGWAVIQSPSRWIGETARDTGFGDLQSATEYAVDNGGILELRGGEYTLTTRWVIPSDLHISVVNPTTINFEPGIDCTNLGLIESTLGVLKISGANLSIDAQGNTGNGAAISSLQKYIQADSRVEIRNLPNGSAYFASFRVNSASISMSGQGYFKQLITENVKNGTMVYGTSMWWDETAPFECSFELGNDCIINCHSSTPGDGVFAYLFNKMLYARVGGCLIKDDNGYYKSFSTNLENGDWTAQSNTTINLNNFTTTGNGGIYTIIPELNVGEKYFCVLGGSTSNSVIEIRNGTTGNAPVIGNTLDQVVSFTAVSSGIYIRVVGSGVTQITDFAVFKSSDVTSNVFQCASADIEGTRYIGVRRGPVIGIDCKNFTVRATKTFGATITGLDIDIESLPGQPQLYPNAYGKVYENLCKYIGLRGLYSTARQLDLLNNTFYFAADTQDSTAKGCIRINTKNETDDYSGVYIAGNRSFGNGNAAFVNAYRGRVKIGPGNIHDSKSSIPYFVDKSGDTPESSSSFEFTNGGEGVSTIFNDTAIPSGNDVFKLDTNVQNFRLPASTFSGCAGWTCQIVRSGNNQAVTITTSSGSINNTGSFIWPANVPMVTVVCASDSNDFYVK